MQIKIDLSAGVKRYALPEHSRVVSVTAWRDDDKVRDTGIFEQVSIAPRALERSEDPAGRLKDGQYAVIDGHLLVNPPPDDSLFVMVTYV